MKWFGAGVACVALFAFALVSCGRQPSTAELGGAAEAATSTYVAPGDTDEYYLFYSGGHSGNVYVGGVPSMRHISTIPVFAPYPATGYGFDDESKKMLGGFTWGDVHHPAISETKGDYDGRWLFVNDNANNRVARIDLRDFKTKQILGPVPNISGFHGGSFIFPLWKMTFTSNQYLDGLTLNIYAYQLEGGKTPARDDLREINALNHYIGMRPLLESDFSEFVWLPFVIGALGVLALRALVIGRMAGLVDVFVLFSYFGLFSLWSFYNKLYAYGHNLDPTAAIKVAPFTPPLFGQQVVGNFNVTSVPGVASFALVAFALLLLAAIFLSRKAGSQ